MLETISSLVGCSTRSKLVEAVELAFDELQPDSGVRGDRTSTDPGEGGVVGSDKDTGGANP